MRFLETLKQPWLSTYAINPKQYDRLVDKTLRYKEYLLCMDAGCPCGNISQVYDRKYIRNICPDCIDASQQNRYIAEDR